MFQVLSKFETLLCNMKQSFNYDNMLDNVNI